jgi:hypothetical protein
MMQHRSRSRQGRQGRCRLMAAGWPEVAETHGINEAIGITRELFVSATMFRSLLPRLVTQSRGLVHVGLSGSCTLH